MVPTIVGGVKRFFMMNVDASHEEIHTPVRRKDNAVGEDRKRRLVARDGRRGAVQSAPFTGLARAAGNRPAL
jgi:hypothetical protein